MKRTLGTISALILLYFGAGVLLHQVVFPTPAPPRDLFFEPGNEYLNEDGDILIKITGREPGGWLLTESTLQSKADGPRPHVHRAIDEEWTVVRGQVTFVVDDERVTLGPGQSAFAPAGTAHTFLNESGDEALMKDRRHELQLFHIYQMNRFIQERGQEATFGKISLQRSVSGMDLYLPDINLALQQLIFSSMAPTARLLGYEPFNAKYVPLGHVDGQQRQHRWSFWQDTVRTYSALPGTGGNGRRYMAVVNPGCRTTWAGAKANGRPGRPSEPLEPMC